MNSQDNSPLARYYLDRSVLFDLHDEVHGEITDELLNQFKMNNILIITSNLVCKELPHFDEVTNRLMDYPAEGFVHCASNDDVEILATEYILAKSIKNASLSDCRQIALATVNKANVYLSWNFTDVYAISTIQGINMVNKRLGYDSLEIRSPKDFLYTIRASR